MFHVILYLCYKTICENSLAVSYKMEHVTTLWSRDCTPRHLSQKNGIYLCAHRNLYTNVYSSFIPNSSKLETGQMAFNSQGFNKLCNHTTEYYSAIKKNKILMHVGTEMHLKNMLSEKSLTREATHCMMPFTWQNYRDRPDCWLPVAKGVHRGQLERDPRGLLGWQNIPYTDCSDSLHNCLSKLTELYRSLKKR